MMPSHDGQVLNSRMPSSALYRFSSLAGIVTAAFSGIAVPHAVTQSTTQGLPLVTLGAILGALAIVGRWIQGVRAVNAGNEPPVLSLWAPGVILSAWSIDAALSSDPALLLDLTGAGLEFFGAIVLPVMAVGLLSVSLEEKAPPPETPDEILQTGLRRQVLTTLAQTVGFVGFVLGAFQLVHLVIGGDERVPAQVLASVIYLSCCVAAAGALVVGTYQVIQLERERRKARRATS